MRSALALMTVTLSKVRGLILFDVISHSEELHCTEWERGLQRQLEGSHFSGRCHHRGLARERLFFHCIR